PEVVPRRRGDAVALVAVVVLVEVRDHDLFLAVGPRILLREADRLDDLLDLSLVDAGVESALREEPRPDELLGDRRGSPITAAGGVDRRRDDAQRVEAGVLPEGLVLDRGRRVDEHRRELVIGVDDLALGLAKAGQLDLSGSVEDDSLLVEGELAERGLR